MAELKVGDKAPDFDLMDEHGLPLDVHRPGWEPPFRIVDDSAPYVVLEEPPRNEDRGRWPDLREGATPPVNGPMLVNSAVGRSIHHKVGAGLNFDDDLLP